MMVISRHAPSLRKESLVPWEHKHCQLAKDVACVPLYVQPTAADRTVEPVCSSLPLQDLILHQVLYNQLIYNQILHQTLIQPVKLPLSAAVVEPSGVCAVKPWCDLPLNTQVCFNFYLFTCSESNFCSALLFWQGRTLLCVGAMHWLEKSYGSLYTLTLSLGAES